MLYLVKFDAYNAFVAVDNENNVTYYSTAEFVYNTNIRDVEDETSWENDCRGMNFNDFINSGEILDKCEFETQ